MNNTVDDPKKNSYQVLRVDTRLPWQIRATSASRLLGSDFRLLIMIYDMYCYIYKVRKRELHQAIEFYWKFNINAVRNI